MLFKRVVDDQLYTQPLIVTGVEVGGGTHDIVYVTTVNNSVYPQTDYLLKHVIGIDTSKLLASRIGVRNDNDLVWVGQAANYAAKLSNLSNEIAIRITHSVYDQMQDSVKFGGANKTSMWEERLWTDMNNLKIYRSNWKFGV